MNIDAFKANIIKKPLLDPTRYTVRISGPVGALSRELTLNCSSVVIPGRSFATTERFDHGPIRKVPYSEIYNDVETTFYVTDTLEEHEFFNRWQELIGGSTSYGLAYYANIIGSVRIEIENKQDKKTAEYELFEAYPMSISPIELGYNLTGMVQLFRVTWAYHHMERR